MTTLTNNLEKPENSYQRFSEATGIFLLAVSMTILLSLLSYDPQDSAWNVVSIRPNAINWIGSLGAWISDALFQIFGLSAFIIPVLLMTIGWRTLRLHQARLMRRKFIGLFLALISMAGLLSLPPMPSYKENVQFGGAIGQLLARSLEAELNKLGTGIILLVILIFALMMATEFSFNVLFESARVRTTVDSIVATELAWRGKWNDMRNSWKINRETRRQAREEKRQAALKARQERANQYAREQEQAKRLKTEQLEAKKLKQQEQLRANAIPTTPTIVTTPPVQAPPKVVTSEPIKAVVEEKAPVEPKVIKKELPSVPTIISNNNQSNSAPNTIVGAVVPPQRYQLPDIDALRKVVYGEEETNETIEEFSLSGSVASLDVNKRLEESAQPIKKREGQVPPVGSNDVPVMRRRSDTIQVPKSSPRASSVTMTSDNANSVIDQMLESAAIERRVEEEQAVTPIVMPALPVPYSDFVLPSTDMLTVPPPQHEQDDAELWDRARLVAEKCNEFSVSGKIQNINPGPVVTTFEFKPDPGVKYSRITGLVDDLCLALKAESVRIERMPGKSTVGIEVPNLNREVIYLREIFESEKYKSASSPLTLALGKSIEGTTYIADLMRMPHLLIAGATGTGKSVCLNSLIVSILYKASPEEVKMIMVDPKRLELGLYEGIPHLLTPIVLEPKRASSALKWAVGEMENRYKMLAGHGVRNIDQYNQQIRQRYNQPDISGERPKLLPYIVIIIDELADLMMVASSDVETSITRLAQMARAVGIHLIIATQRPSVDVITGLIKANFPSRISFRVSSKIDSRTILDTNGAEALLGQGDMLFLPPGTSRLIRVHGAYVNEGEINRIVDHIRAQGRPEYNENIQMLEEETEAGESGGDKDKLYEEAIKVICEMKKASTSVLQRRLRIGYGRAASILDMLEIEGCVGPSDGSKPREVKPRAYEYLERVEQMAEE